MFAVKPKIGNFMSFRCLLRSSERGKSDLVTSTFLGNICTYTQLIIKHRRYLGIGGEASLPDCRVLSRNSYCSCYILTSITQALLLSS